MIQRHSAISDEKCFGRSNPPNAIIRLIKALGNRHISPYIQCIYIGGYAMIVEFCKWGNSLAVRIPKVLADIIKVSDGKRAEIKIENGALVLRPIVKPARKPSYTLDELLSGMTRDNVPQEVDWGIKRGNEAW
jgi:antitoxin MazE